MGYTKKVWNGVHGGSMKWGTWRRYGMGICTAGMYVCTRMYGMLPPEWRLSNLCLCVCVCVSGADPGVDAGPRPEVHAEVLYGCREPHIRPVTAGSLL